MREVKEVRIGKYLKDFDRWPEESRRVEPSQCFIVLYGSEFKLKTLSIAGKSKAGFPICARTLQNVSQCFMICSLKTCMRLIVASLIRGG